MRTIGVFDGLKNIFRNRSPGTARFQMVQQRGNGFFSWNGKLYHSDIVRACIRPKIKAMGKLVAKHVRETVGKDGTKAIAVNPDAYMRFLLEEPNPYMSGQKLQEKLAAQLALNGNAFALIIRDEAQLPMEIYPLPADSVEARYSEAGVLFLSFVFRNGKRYSFPYSDIIHLRHDYFDNDIFGTSIAPVLAPLMEIVNITDQGIVKAVKNSNVIQWLLKINSALRPEDVQKTANEFAANYMKIDSDSFGVAATDTKADAIQVEPKNYVPNAAQMDRVTLRIQSLLGVNDKIVRSDYSEDEWNAYYEAEVEPDNLDLRNEYTRKLFTRKARAFGNRIIFEAANLATASTKTKLGLSEMVDRGALTPNEWREVWNWAPVQGGDKPIRRLDTAEVNKKKAKEVEDDAED